MYSELDNRSLTIIVITLAVVLIAQMFISIQAYATIRNKRGPRGEAGPPGPRGFRGS